MDYHKINNDIASLFSLHKTTLKKYKIFLQTEAVTLIEDVLNKRYFKEHYFAQNFVHCSENYILMLKTRLTLNVKLFCHLCYIKVDENRIITVLKMFLFTPI